MAKQSGLVRYIGTLDNVRHFKIKGSSEYYAAMKGGVSKERIMNDSEFERTRENMSEFGGVAKANKAFRSSLLGLQKKASDGTKFANRITSALFKVMRKDTTSERGKRSVMISENSQYLVNMEWNASEPLTSVMSAPFSVTASTDHKSATLTVPAMTPEERMSLRKDATHVRFVLLVSAVSDYGYDAETGEYSAKNLEAEGNGTVAVSDYVAVNEEMAADLTVSASITIDDLENVTAFASVGVELYEQVNGKYYRLNDEKVMKTVAAL